MAIGVSSGKAGRRGRRKRRGLRRLHEDLVGAGELIRRQPSSAGALATAASLLHESLGAARVSVWSLGSGEPALAHQVPDPGGEAVSPPQPSAEEPPIPSAVTRCAAGGVTVHNPLAATLTVPVVGAADDVHAALHMEGVPASGDHRSFAESLARQLALAMEAAALRDEVSLQREKSEAILGRIGDGVAVADGRGAISQLNEAAEGILGCKAAEAVGRRCEDVLGLTVDGMPLDCSRGCPLVAAEHGDRVLGHEVFRNLPDGRRQPLLVKVEALHNSSGEVAEVVHSLRDITKLREADEAKTMFLATASHELKTPLTVILGYSDALRNDPFWNAKDRNRALDAVQRRSQELAEIVDRLLLSSRIEAGRNELTVGDVDVAPLIEERTGSMGEATGRRVVAKIEPGLPKARGNDAALATVIDHLVDNAIKYSPEGGDVTVSAWPDGSHVAISVADEGIGMTPEEAANCMNKFWQAESSDARRFGGTGIGLFIVSSLVSQMGGEVEATSEPGQGTTFTVRLERAEEVEREAGDTETRDPIEPEPSVIREFMRQMGVPEGGRR